MRLGIRFGHRFGLVALMLLVVLSLRLGQRPSQDDNAYDKVKDVITREGFDHMRPIHRRMLASIVENNVRTATPTIAACWEFAPTDQEVIDAFNAAITMGASTGTEFQQANRWSNTALSGGGLSQGQPTIITYSFVPDGTNLPSGVGEPTAPSNLFSWLNGIYGNAATWQAIFAQEFTRWSDVSGLTYVYEPNDDGVSLSSASGAAGVRGDIRISAKFIDGNSGILAYNSFPNNGDMVLDSADNFYTNTNNNSRRLRNVFSHEHGHGVGMFHVCPTDGTKLMEPFINTGFLGPQHDEILNVQRHYGDANEPNDTVVAATDVGVLAAGISTITGASTDDNTDTDVFKFTTSSPHTVDITLRPIGLTYPEGPQTGSCNTSAMFNSLTVSDLAIEFIDSDGTTILGTANANPAGQNELIAGILLPNSGDYYVRVTPDSTNNVQMYEVDIDLGVFVPTNFAIQFPDGRPASIDADYVNHLRVETVNFTGSPDSANAFVYVRVDGGPFVQLPMIDQGNSIWWANLPPAPCFSKVDYYIEMFPLGGGPAERSPAGAPGFFHTADVLQRNTVTVFSDDFETDQGWTVLNEASLTGGAWERGVPSGDGTRGDTVVDFDGSGNCYLTENGAGNTDVDNGRTRLISPVMDLSGFASVRLKYAFWYSNDFGNNPNQDTFDVHVRESSSSSWVLVEAYNANANNWLEREIVIADFISLTSTFQIRFRAQDLGGGSVVEAAVDAVIVEGCPFDNEIGPPSDGSVGLHLGPAAPILFVNSTTGGPDRQVFVNVNTPYFVSLANPPGFAGAEYAMFLKIGRPSPFEAFPISLQAGEMAFTPALADPLNPLLFTVAWTAPNPPAGVLDPTATLTPWFSVASSGFPFPIIASLQVVILEGPILKVSNMVTLTIQ